MKNMVFWIVTPCGSEKARRFAGTFSRSKIIPSKKPEALLTAYFCPFLVLFTFDSEFGGDMFDMFLRNVDL
jgi:hypothetical protein